MCRCRRGMALCNAAAFSASSAARSRTAIHLAFVLFVAAAPARGIRVQIAELSEEADATLPETAGAQGRSTPSEGEWHEVSRQSLPSAAARGPADLVKNPVDHSANFVGFRMSEQERSQPADCTSKTLVEAMRVLRSRSHVEDHGEGCLADSGTVLGCKATCQCNMFQHCYPHAVCGTNVGTCELAMPVLVILSGVIFLFLLALIVTFRMLFQMQEDPKVEHHAFRSDLARRSFKGRTSRTLTTSEWPKIDEDEQLPAAPTGDDKPLERQVSAGSDDIPFVASSLDDDNGAAASGEGVTGKPLEKQPGDVGTF